MALVNTVELMKHADKHSYAIGAFNVVSLEFLNGILEAAKEMRSPVILNIAEVHFSYVDIEQITPAIKYMADKVCVPVVLNLDHGLSVETVVRAIKCGFSAVMYDGSKKPIEQNIEDTRLVVKMAHSVGVSVEAEIGHVGGGEGGTSGKTKARRELFTNPDEAELFVKETGVDSLAVSVGNVHGFYAGDPELDFELIETIKKRVGIPLVLHGGSGISDEDFRHAVKLGIRKINFFTEMSKLATDRVREMVAGSPEYFIQDLLKEAQKKIKEVVMDRMRVFGSANACDLPGSICVTGGCSTIGTSTCSNGCSTCSCGTHSGNTKAKEPQKSLENISEAEIASIVKEIASRLLGK